MSEIPYKEKGEVLRKLAETMDVDKTVESFPGLSRRHLISILKEASDLFPSAVVQEKLAYESGTGALFINVDGAARGNPGPAGAGVIMFDTERQPVCRLKKYLGETTNNVAEYSALLLALEKANKLGAKSVEISSDSELMVRQIQGRYKVKNERLKRLYDEATSLIANFDNFTIRHVLRGFNKEADKLANEAIDDRKKIR
jgi:ribonuclease HI